MPFAHASRLLQRLCGIAVPTSTAWDQVEREGAKLQAWYEQQQQHSSPERTRWEDRHYHARACKSISMDGGMIHIRTEGWKEFKVGCVSDIQTDWSKPEGQTVTLCNLAYTAVIGDVSRFSTAMWSLAVAQQVQYAGRSAVTADGASWIWRLSADLFPVSTQIVDWYHARHHLAQAAQARYPTQAERAQLWYEQMSHALYRGEIWKICQDLRHHHLADHATYFHTHHRRMQYQAFREDGFPIGSGAVESGVKQFKHRLTGAGMRWSRPGAERMLLIRSAVMADSLDRLWACAA
jgi:hypothetical protein